MAKGTKTPKKGTIRALKEKNTPAMFRDYPGRISKTHRAGIVKRREQSQELSSAAAMKARRQQRALHELSEAALGEFPLSPELLAVARKGVGKIRKFRKGHTVIPREIRRLEYRGPKLAPVDEAAEQQIAGGRRRRRRRHSRKTRRGRGRKRRTRRVHWDQLSW